MPARIIIIGGGFVGLPAAKRIAHALGAEGRVTLIDPKEHFTFLPRLTDALENGAVPSEITAPFAPLAERHGFTFVQGAVRSIDRAARSIVYTDAAGNIAKMEYDRLVYCPGSVTNFYGTPGAEEHCLTLKSTEDVKALHARIDSLFDEAQTADDKRKKTLLSFVVVGGGPTGVEAVFAIQQQINRKLKENPDLKPHVSYALVQAAPQILPGFHERIVDGAAMLLVKKGVTVFICEPVISVEAEMVETAHHRRIPAGLVLWAGGIKRQNVPISPAADEDTGHYFNVDRDLRLASNIMGGGDAVSYKEKMLTVPKNAQTAFRMSRNVADNVVRAIRKQPLKHFRYVSRGAFLPLGDTGFIQAGPFVLRSKLARIIRDHYYSKIHRDITG